MISPRHEGGFSTSGLRLPKDGSAVLLGHADVQPSELRRNDLCFSQIAIDLLCKLEGVSGNLVSLTVERQYRIRLTVAGQRAEQVRFAVPSASVCKSEFVLTKGHLS